MILANVQVIIIITIIITIILMIIIIIIIIPALNLWLIYACSVMPLHFANGDVQCSAFMLQLDIF